MENRRGKECGIIVKRLAIYLVFVLCALAPIGAWAQNAAGAPPISKNSIASPWGFTNTIVALQTAGNQIARRALKISTPLLRALLVIAIAWFGIQVMFGAEAASFEAAVSGFVSKIFIWGLITWLMKDYVPLTSAITNGFAWLSNYLVGGNPHPTQLEATAGYFLPGIHLLHMGMVYAHATKSLPWTTGHFWDIGSNAQNFLNSLMAAIVIVIISGLMYLSGMIYIGIAMLSLLLVSLAIAIGPIFIPFFLLDFTSFMFDNWFAFLLTSAAYRLIGGVIIAMIEKFIGIISTAGGVGSILQQTGTKPPVYVINVVASITDILVVVVVIFLMLEIPKIASTLMGGSGISVSAIRMSDLKPGK